MGSSRDRSSGRKDIKKKRRKSRSYSSSKSYEDQGQYQKNQKRNKANNSNMGQGQGNQGNYSGGNQNSNRNNSGDMNFDDSNSGNSGNMQGQGMGQQEHQGHQSNQRGQGGLNSFGNQRMMNNPNMMNPMQTFNNNNFMRPQPPTPYFNLMQMGGQFKMPFQMMPTRFTPMQPMMRQFPLSNKFNSQHNMQMNQSNDQDDQGQSNKKMNKFNDKLQQKNKQLDAEPFVTFKNMSVISGLVEIIQNTCLSLEKSDQELTFYVCKKAFHEILRKLKDINHHRYHGSTEDLLRQLEKQFINEQRDSIKEFNHQKNLKEKNFLFNNTKFNSGIDNVDYQILKLLHKSKKLKDIFELIQTENSNKVDLSLQSDSLARKLLLFTSSQYNDQSSKLYQESIKLFNQNTTQ